MLLPVDATWLPLGEQAHEEGGISLINFTDPRDLVGFAAGIFTTAANLPQVWKTYRDKSAKGLSFRMLLALSCGLFLWIVYRLMCKSAPLTITNAIGTLLILALLMMKFKYDRKPTQD